MATFNVTQDGTIVREDHARVVDEKLANAPPIPKFRKGERAMVKGDAGLFRRIVGTDFDADDGVWWYLLMHPDNSLYEMWTREDYLEKPAVEQVIERLRRGEI